MAVRLMRALKDGVYDKIDTDTTYTDNLGSDLFWVDYPFGSTNDEDYPYGLYRFEGLEEEMELGTRIPAGSDLVLIIDTLVLNQPQVGADNKTTVEDLHKMILDEFYSDGTINVNQYSLAEDWEDPVLQKTFEDVMSEPETNNWHGILRFHGKAVR